MSELSREVRLGNFLRVAEILQTFNGSEHELNQSFKLACLHGQCECVALLLADKRVNPMIGNGWGIRIIADDGDANIMRLLLADKRVNPAIDESWAICAAAENGNETVLRLLFEDGRCNIHTRGDYAIHYAAKEGHLNIVYMLIQWGIKPTIETLRLAASSGQIHIVHVLLEILEPTPCVLYSAAEHGHDDVVKRLLIDSRVDPAIYANQAARIALKNGHHIVVSMLMDDMRVFWTFAKPIERMVWYLRRRQEMTELRHELIMHRAFRN